MDNEYVIGWIFAAFVVLCFALGIQSYNDCVREDRVCESGL